jgi:hypothetical protein
MEDFCYQIMKRGVLVYAYANNHYAGHAPATIEQFRNLWHARGLQQLSKPQPVPDTNRCYSSEPCPRNALNPNVWQLSPALLRPRLSRAYLQKRCSVFSKARMMRSLGPLVLSPTR